MNSEWCNFLAEEYGAGLESGRVAHFGHPEQELSAAVHGSNLCSDLSHLGLIAVRGIDTDVFLQGQLTCDVHHATLDHSLFGALCSPKGRALACFRVFRRGDAVYLELPHEQVESTLARLNKYVLRAKVTLEDASDSLVRLGVAGPNIPALLTSIFGAVPDVVNRVMHIPADGSGITLIRSPGPIPRFEVHGPLSNLQTLWKTLDGDVTFAGEEPWRLLDILAGVPTVYAETAEAFVPQMLNLQMLEGISFQKGCYTGQEVVARTHYLGKLKRRMYVAQVDSPKRPRPGDPLFSPQADASQSAGRIVDAAKHPDGGYAVLAAVLIECAEQGALHLDDVSGPMLKVEPPPYGFEVAA